ncbi:Ark- serine/threonine protein kinase [Neurospora sp. IMI 360204]|nr:Ark- serine/threonine protein kinase [Neurospora sp. IMI 360204]
MASFGQAVPAAAPRPGPYGAAYGAPVAVSAPAAPAGTFAPGTKIQCGSHRVVIQKYLSEGGFAHVYLVKLPAAVNGTDLAVLKRVAVPDKEALRGMRTEVETMKRLKGHKAIVTYIDSHASEMRGTGGYEVFLLMEYCNGGGLIDFMNTRLQHRLTEPEILNIFSDVAEGVACMHYLKPPLLHRDLKVENVLINMIGSVRKFKLCDFGSAASPRPAPTTVTECRLVDEDIQKHTTMQYRSPEMVDVYRKQPIDEKSDIWALGVLLYKLCYYTTPFEEGGTLAILNASYKFHSYPVFSDRLKKLIAWMLQENQQARPNIYQVLREACAMQGKEPPVKDIYTGTHADTRKREHSQSQIKSPPVVGVVFAAPVVQQQVIPEVERMRRGRLPAPSQPVSQPTTPSPGPGKVTNGDPFAALDTKLPPKNADELSNKFPTLDQFSLLHDRGTKFDFDSGVPQPPQQQKDMSQRVAERLADEVFKVKPSPSPTPVPASQRVSLDLNKGNPYAAAMESQRISPSVNPASTLPRQGEPSRASAIISSIPELKTISSPSSQSPFQSPPPTRPKMVSTGTMTESPPPAERYRAPPAEHHRAASVPRQHETGPTSFTRAATTVLLSPGAAGSPNASSSSSRPSLEGGRPSYDAFDLPTRSKQHESTRPASIYLESDLTYLREKEAAAKPLHSPSLSGRFSFDKAPPSPKLEEERNIRSSVEFLRSMEDADTKKKDKGAKHHSKRSSLSSLSAGTKNLFAGKFGDAFKRFEGGVSNSGPPRSPSSLKDIDAEVDRFNKLTPIAGSEATDDRSDEGRRFGDDNVDEMTPEMRREEEARMLAVEEARVAAAQAEYRARVAQRTGTGSGTAPTPPPKSIGGVPRAMSIQNKVQSLLDESSRSAPVSRTAHGYGHYTDADAGGPRGSTDSLGDSRPSVAKKPIAITGQPMTGSLPRPPTSSGMSSMEQTMTGRASMTVTGAKPAAPPKPTRLTANLTAGGGAGSPPRQSYSTSTISLHKQLRPGTSSSSLMDRDRSDSIGAARGADYSRTSREALVAVEGLPGQNSPMLLQMSAAEKDDYIKDFQKRFPSLTSIEMVETDVGAGSGTTGSEWNDAR